ncbi:MAG: hypothetical protein J1F09_08040 [Oscillospiraceae bacterium]|nr:hypothetical protein [Oscillospiraceae bacterium]
MTYDYYKTLLGEYINFGRSEEQFLGEVGYPADLDLSADGLIAAISIIAAVTDGDFKRLVDLSGLKMTDFSRKFAIPYRTVQDWCSKDRTPPEYLPMLIGYAMIGDLPSDREQ